MNAIRGDFSEVKYLYCVLAAKNKGCLRQRYQSLREKYHDFAKGAGVAHVYVECIGNRQLGISVLSISTTISLSWG